MLLLFGFLLIKFICSVSSISFESNLSASVFISSERSFVLILSLAISSESTCFIKVWNGIDGSNKVDVCFTCLRFAKSLSFLGNPFVNISLHFKLIVAGLSLHQPFFSSCCTLNAKCLTISLSFFVNANASTCAYYAVFWDENCFLNNCINEFHSCLYVSCKFLYQSSGVPVNEHWINAILLACQYLYSNGFVGCDPRENVTLASMFCKFSSGVYWWSNPSKGLIGSEIEVDEFINVGVVYVWEFGWVI